MKSIPFEKLFQPIQIGRMTIKNRVMMPAMATRSGTSDHFVTEHLISHYARRAQGGAGLIVVEATCVDDPVGLAGPYQLCIDGDQYVPGLNRLARDVQSHGAKIAIELHHAGPKSHFAGGSAQLVAPCALGLPEKPHIIPRELDKEGIKVIVKKFWQGAMRAREAGFDAVELLLAHGYLLNRFLSPHTNKRQDEYGGSLEGRAKIVSEIIEAIKDEAGEDFPILCKIPGDDYVDEGINLEESIKICRLLKDLGVGALTISGGGYSEARFTHIGPMSYSQGWQVHLAETIRRNVHIPIVAIGKIKRPEFAEGILAEGKADMVAMGRALLADPDLVLKAQSDELDSIIPCISCNHCLDRIVDEGRTIRCSVNPLVGREHDTRVMKAGRPKKVVVVGGGPAGMQVAIQAASRGHEVTILEKSDKLGGQLKLACIPRGKEEISSFVNYLAKEIERKGVKVQLGVKATPRSVEEMSPEVVVVATGALPLIPSIPGVGLDHVVSAWDALMDPERVKENVVVIGGGLVGCEVACFLSVRGKKVTVIEQMESVGLDMGSSARRLALQELNENGVRILTKCLVKAINKNGVELDETSEMREIAADTIILAVGATSDREFLKAMESARTEVYAIGDCISPRRIVHAISHGFDLGYRL